MGSGANLSFGLSGEVGEILGGLRTFVETEVASRHRAHREMLDDPRQRYGPDGLYTPAVRSLIREVRTSSSAAGYYTMFVPEAIGGAGLGYEALYRVWEDLFHHFGPHLWLMSHAVAHWARGPSRVLVHASAEARRDTLPGLLAGETSMCFAMSEPDAGSDARRMKTRAAPGGGGWVIDGSKIWITNAPYADYAVVFAQVDEGPAQGISAFLIATDTPGVRVEGSIRMFGDVGGDEAVMYFDGVRAGPEAVLGEVGSGFSIAMAGVNSGRIYNSARAVGLARWALEAGVDYVSSRHAFGQPVANYQGVAFPLAESAMEIHAAHLMGLNCALLLDQGHQPRKEISMAKAFSTEAAVRAIDRVIQAHGAIGFTNELGLAEAYHAIRKARVADGTSEILRRSIVERMLKGDMEL